MGRIGILVLLALVVTATEISGGRQQVGTPVPIGTGVTTRQVSRDTYVRVMDRLFARDRTADSWNLFLRFESSLRPESQIASRASLTNTEVTEEVLARPNGLFASLNGLVQGGAREDVDQLAQQFSVRTRVVQIPAAEVAAWLDGLFKSLPQAFPILRSERERASRDQLQGVMLHECRYLLWVQPGTDPAIPVEFQLRRLRCRRKTWRRSRYREVDEHR